MLEALDHLVRNQGDGIFVDLENGAVAVGDVIRAVVPHVLRQVDHAKAAVHPAVLVLVPDLEPVSALLQYAEGGPAGDFSQGGGALVGLFVEGLLNDGPDGGVQGIDGDGELRLLRGEDGAVYALGHHLEAVVGPGAQAAQVILEVLRQLQSVQQNPALLVPLLELVALSPGFVPLQGVDPGLRLAADQVQIVAQQVLALHADEIGGGAAENIALSLDGHPDKNLQRMLIAGQHQGAALLVDVQADLLCAGGGHLAENAVRLVQRENLIESRDLAGELPGEGERAGPRRAHRFRGLQVREADLCHQLLAVQPAKEAQEVFPLRHSLDADRHGQGVVFQEDMGMVFQLLGVPAFARKLQVVEHRGYPGSGGLPGRSVFSAAVLRLRPAAGPGFRPIQLGGSVRVQADADIPLAKDEAGAAGYVEISRRQGQSRQREGGGSSQNDFSSHQIVSLQGSDWDVPRAFYIPLGAQSVRIRHRPSRNPLPFPCRR